MWPLPRSGTSGSNPSGNALVAAGQWATKLGGSGRADADDAAIVVAHSTTRVASNINMVTADDWRPGRTAGTEERAYRGGDRSRAAPRAAGRRGGARAAAAARSSASRTD